MKNLLFCYTFLLKTMKFMVWLRCSALGEASQKYAHILQKVRNHVLAHGGMDFLDISLISQSFCYIFPRVDIKSTCLAQLLCQD